MRRLFLLAIASITLLSGCAQGAPLWLLLLVGLACGCAIRADAPPADVPEPVQVVVAPAPPVQPPASRTALLPPPPPLETPEAESEQTPRARVRVRGRSARRPMHRMLRGGPRWDRKPFRDEDDRGRR